MYSHKLQFKFFKLKTNNGNKESIQRVECRYRSWYHILMCRSMVVRFVTFASSTFFFTKHSYFSTTVFLLLISVHTHRHTKPHSYTFQKTGTDRSISYRMTKVTERLRRMSPSRMTERDSSEKLRKHRVLWTRITLSLTRRDWSDVISQTLPWARTSSTGVRIFFSHSRLLNNIDIHVITHTYLTLKNSVYCDKRTQQQTPNCRWF